MGELKLVAVRILGVATKVGGKGVALKVGEKAAMHLIPLHKFVTALYMQITLTFVHIPRPINQMVYNSLSTKLGLLNDRRKDFKIRGTVPFQCDSINRFGQLNGLLLN